MMQAFRRGLRALPWLKSGSMRNFAASEEQHLLILRDNKIQSRPTYNNHNTSTSAAIALTSQTMSTPTPASAAVAARVFAIPELLEHILLASAIEDEDDENISKPADSLFCALRVNHTFKGTIDGSTKLQRLMFLQTCSSSDDTFERRYSPILWLLAQVGMELDVSANILQSRSQRLALFPDIDFFDLDVEDDESQYHALQDECNAFKERYGAPEASWRNMLVAIGPDAYSIVIGFSIHMGYYDTQEAPAFSEKGVVEWEFEANEKIGEVWNKYQKLMGTLKAQEHGIKAMAVRRRDERFRDQDLLRHCAYELGGLGD